MPGVSVSFTLTLVALQLYRYTQARVLRYGLEPQAACRLTDHWQLHA